MRTLLLADDSITIQRVIALTFAGEPIHIVAVSDGQQAMARLAERPDIVLAATTLSQVSGYDLAHYVRSKAELHEVPVLLLSGAFETVDEAKLKASGANGVIEKPVEPIAVIARVKELLGFKSEPKPATVGRLVTSPDGASDRKLPGTLARSVTSTRATPSNWEQLREQTGLGADTQSVEAPSLPAKADQSTLDVAFDSLDQQLSGRAPHANSPSGHQGQAESAADPRSHGRAPDVTATPGNPVFEVDEQWFGGAESRGLADARAGRREMIEDLGAPEFQAAPAAPESAPVFEVDEEWFADDNKTRAAKDDEQRRLAAEMGIHDVELPEAEPPLEPAPVIARDFDFSLDDLKALEQAAPAVGSEPEASSEAVAPIEAAIPIEPVTPTEPVVPVEPTMPIEPVAPVEPEPAVEAVAPIEPLTPVEPEAPAMPTAPVAVVADAAPIAPAADPHGVADDFAALLAYEQGEPLERPEAAAPIEAPSPQLTDDMLDQIAALVADRLSAGLLGEQLKSVLTDTVRDTVRSIVSETSERLVRDEIDRIRGRH